MVLITKITALKATRVLYTHIQTSTVVSTRGALACQGRQCLSYSKKPLTMARRTWRPPKVHPSARVRARMEAWVWEQTSSTPTSWHFPGQGAQSTTICTHISNSPLQVWLSMTSQEFAVTHTGKAGLHRGRTKGEKRWKSFSSL